MSIVFLSLKMAIVLKITVYMCNRIITFSVYLYREVHASILAPTVDLSSFFLSITTTFLCKAMYVSYACADPEGGPPWIITKILGSFALLASIPLKSQCYQASIQCWVIIGPQVKCQLNGVSLAGRWWTANSGIPPSSPHQIKFKKKEKKKKSLSQLDPLWQDKTFWIRACYVSFMQGWNEISCWRQLYDWFLLWKHQYGARNC